MPESWTWKMHGNAKEEDSPDDSSHAPSSASPDPITFVFVNQAEDVTALMRRRISNQQQRHVIRSHVMQRVRHLESAQGKSRTAAREIALSDNSRTSWTSTESGTSIKDEPVKDEPMSPVPGKMAVLPKRRKPGGFVRSATPLNPSPASHAFDPFQTLPSNNLPHESSESLLGYCFDVLLPLTFAVEFKQPQERLARQAMVLQSKINSPATFLGFMATVAAHRAILYGRHKDLAPSNLNHDELITDPDYKRVKHEAIVAVRRFIEKSKTADQYMVDACFGLVSTATVVGNFEEARMHLKGIAHIVALVGSSQESLLWLPITNVKVSVGLLQKPILALPWTREAIPTETLQRIAPHRKSALARLGADFKPLTDLSDTIRSLLTRSRDICYFVEFNAANPSGLTPPENATLRQSAVELEYDLVAYPYDIPDFFFDGEKEPTIPTLESVIRTAALGFMSLAPHTIMPSTGLGRALTHHQKRATEAWLRERQGKSAVPELKAVFWSLFIFAQCALKQPEEDFFLNLISQTMRDLWPLSWPEAERILTGFLYIPRLQRVVWKRIWTQVTSRSEALRIQLASNLSNGHQESVQLPSL
ncbi:hypothetical protein LTR67_002708 [Exophiala xenobiotica]